VKVQDIKLDKIIPYENNPRINEETIGEVARIIEEVGWRQPIVVDENMVILAGHTRLGAAKLLKHKTAPVHIAEGLTEAQKKVYRLADNRLSEMSTWDYGGLKTELEELADLEIDLSLTGFSELMIKNLIDSGEEILDPDQEIITQPDIGEKTEGYKSLIVHFLTEDDWKAFFKLIEQNYTDKTKYVWFPEQKDA
jgi:ParB-like chromosome segregation protein Spo0J